MNAAKQNDAEALEQYFYADPSHRLAKQYAQIRESIRKLRLLEEPAEAIKALAFSERLEALEERIAQREAEWKGLHKTLPY